MKVYDLKTEYLTQPNAVDTMNPRFSWKIESDKPNVIQKSYRIIAKCGNDVIWDSGIVDSDECRFIRYDGKELKSRQKVTWSVSVVCSYMTNTATSVKEEIFSDEARFQMGLLKESDWIGEWISADKAPDKDARKPAAYLRREFEVRENLKSARIYQSAHGLYESFLNGRETDEDKFKPGLTSYYYRIQYQTYDITSLISVGKNSWSVVIADGWWRGTTGGSVKNNFGYTLDYIGQIELEYEDGTVERIGSDENFKVGQGQLLASDMLMGDIVDRAKEPEGWKTTGFDDTLWSPAYLTEKIAENRLLTGLEAEKIASRSVPVREMEHFSGKAFYDHNGDLIIDFGQNIAGYVKMTFRDTKAGQKIVVTHCETLDHDGNFTIENVDKTGLIIDAFQQVTYICEGANKESYKPSFSIFGFRYIKIEGYEGAIQDGDFVAIAVYSAMEETGDFECSNPLLNQLVRNSRWSQKGNFMDVPVDCPTRERNAWTGDAQIYVRCANTFMDGYSFYEKWLQDQSLEQYESGKVGITFPSTSSVHNPNEIEAMKQMNPTYELAGPTGNGNIGEDAVGWGDSAVWLPYSVYLYHGDRQILENQYETAKKWLEYEIQCAKEDNESYIDTPAYNTYTDGVKDAEYIFDTKFHYGEWNEAFGVKEKVEEYYKALEEKKENEKKSANNEVQSTTELLSRGNKTIEEQIADKQKAAAGVQYFLQMKAKTGSAVVATAYMARSAENVAEMARILGKEEEARHYEQVYANIKRVYNKYLIGKDGVIEPGHQAPYVRVLAMDLCDDTNKKLVLNQLLKEVEEADYSLNTGFLSTPFLLPVLAENGYVNEAFKILENEELPGWLYPIKKGMTTIPESWGGVDLLEDSLNHYSYGAVCEFLFQYIAGIRIDESNPGYKRFVLKPVVGGTLTHASASIKTHYGEIKSSWKISNNKFYYKCKVPENTNATIVLPDGMNKDVGSGMYEFECDILYKCKIKVHNVANKY